MANDEIVIHNATKYSFILQIKKLCLALACLMLKDICSAQESESFPVVSSGKPTEQISRYNHYGIPAHVVDGNKDSNYHHSSCTHTREYHNNSI